MALDFAADNRRVTHGSDVSLDNLASGGTFTVLHWLRRTGTGIGHWGAKDTASATATWAGLLSSGSTGVGRLVVPRDTTTADYITSTVIYPADTWAFVAYVYDDGAANHIAIYYGDTSTLAQEASYSTATDGAGTYSRDDSGQDLWMGNREGASSLETRGEIQRVGIWNTALTLGEVQDLQASGVEAWGSDTGNVLACRYDDETTVSDQSGNGNDGTVTGATLAKGPWAAGPVVDAPTTQALVSRGLVA